MFIVVIKDEGFKRPQYLAYGRLTWRRVGQRKEAEKFSSADLAQSASRLCWFGNAKIEVVEV